MTDAEYLNYLKTKSFAELEDMLGHFNKAQNPKKYEVIRQVWEEKKSQDPKGFAEFAKAIRYETIHRRIGAALADLVFVWIFYALGIHIATKITLETEFLLILLRHFSHLLWALIILVPMMSKGKTLGMHLAGVKLFDASENESTHTQRLLREGIFIFPQMVIGIFPELFELSWTLTFFGLQLSAIALANPIVIYFDSKHRGLNDMIAKTVILRHPARAY